MNIKQISTLLRILAILSFLLFLWQTYAIYSIMATPKLQKQDFRFPLHYDNDIEKKYAEKYENNSEELLVRLADRMRRMDIRNHLVLSISSLIIGLLLLAWAYDRRKLEKQVNSTPV